MKVKVCGITNIEDGLAAAKLGAWALGFMCYGKSKRYVEPELAKSIIDELRQSLAKPPLMVGVFVNESIEQLTKTKSDLNLDYIQLHGDEDLAYVAQLDEVILARRPENQQDLTSLQKFADSVDYLLIDAAVAGEYGGTGHKGDWQLVRDAKSMGIPVILAGGINPDNIQQAWQEVQPFAIDLSSGVEQKPGKKSLEKLQLLFSKGS